MREDNVAAVVLAAGLGTRLHPISTLVPKPLCTVNNEPLIDLAISNLRQISSSIAVNCRDYAGPLAAHLKTKNVYISFEDSVRGIGTAGAIGILRDWINGRPAVIQNSDSYIQMSSLEFLEKWDRGRIALGVRRTAEISDFGQSEYMGICAMPWDVVKNIQPITSGLYEAVWRQAWHQNRIQLIELDGVSIDCGTPDRLLRANLVASGGASVVHPTAQVLGRIERSLIMQNSTVGPNEFLKNSIRCGPFTINVNCQASG